MDAVHVTRKRIEQSLAQLQRELRRYGNELPTQSFIVHTSADGVRVELTDAPLPLPIVQPTKTPAPVVEYVKEARFDSNKAVADHYRSVTDGADKE